MRSVFSVLLVLICSKAFCFVADTTSNVRLMVTYMNEPFTRGLVLNKKFQPDQLVPLVFQLDFIDSTTIEEGDYLTIKSVVVYFVKDYDVPMMSQKRNDHLVMMALRWPNDFPLVDGARVVINVDYNYHRKNTTVLFTKMLTHEVTIATGDVSQILAERKKLRDSFIVNRETYDNDSRLKGCVLSTVAGESWEVIFNGGSLMKFKSSDAQKVGFNVERLAAWSRTQEINEFIFYKKSWLGRKRIHLKIPYSTAGKYLLIVIKPKGRKGDLFYVEWTNTDPLTNNFSRIYPHFLKK
jgi:hypothetical protein